MYGNSQKCQKLKNKAKNMIKEARKNAGLTQKEFSEIFEIPIDVVKSWDSGRRKPPAWAEKLIVEKLNRIKNEADD